MRIAIAGSTGLVGRHLTGLAEWSGHQTVGLSRSTGTDLLTGPAPDLTGCDAVIDVTQGDDHGESGATDFFTTVAATLGVASRAAGIRRTVVLSILGAEETAAENGYHAAKLAHERATREAADGVRILRAAQFHDFPAQWSAWMAHDGVVEVPDQPIQPVSVDAVCAALLELATEPEAPEVLDLAGPRVESLPDLVARTSPSLRVVTVPVGPKTAGGALLAGAHTRVAGPDFDTWSAQLRT